MLKPHSEQYLSIYIIYACQNIVIDFNLINYTNGTCSEFKSRSNNSTIIILIKRSNFNFIDLNFLFVMLCTKT